MGGPGWCPAAIKEGEAIVRAVVEGVVVERKIAVTK
jgi:hypothetical protein